MQQSDQRQTHCTSLYESLEMTKEAEYTLGKNLSQKLL